MCDLLVLKSFLTLELVYVLRSKFPWTLSVKILKIELID